MSQDDIATKSWFPKVLIPLGIEMKKWEAGSMPVSTLLTWVRDFVTKGAAIVKPDDLPPSGKFPIVDLD